MKVYMYIMHANNMHQGVIELCIHMQQLFMFTCTLYIKQAASNINVLTAYKLIFHKASHIRTTDRCRGVTGACVDHCAGRQGGQKLWKPPEFTVTSKRVASQRAAICACNRKTITFNTTASIPHAFIYVATMIMQSLDIDKYKSL